MLVFARHVGGKTTSMARMNKKYVRLQMPAMVKKEKSSPMPLTKTLTIKLLQAWWISVADCLSHCLRLAIVPSIVFFNHRLILVNTPVVAIILIEEVETGSWNIGRKLSPKGRARSIPSIPINRSTTSDAVTKDADIPVRIAPAIQTTSSPIVVGKTLDENKPAKVSLRLF